MKDENNEVTIEKIKYYEDNIFKMNFLEFIKTSFTKLDNDEFAIINEKTDEIEFLLQSMQNKYKLLIGYYLVVISIINGYNIKKRKKRRNF